MSEEREQFWKHFQGVLSYLWIHNAHHTLIGMEKYIKDLETEVDELRAFRKEKLDG